MSSHTRNEHTNMSFGNSMAGKLLNRSIAKDKKAKERREKAKKAEKEEPTIVYPKNDAYYVDKNGHTKKRAGAIAYSKGKFMG
jgi:hypothetical protein